jgi:uncharacterized protein YbjQ (UPF0145 family)
MHSIKSKLVISFAAALLVLFVLPSMLLAGDKREPEQIWLSEDEVDTAYQIEKLITVNNTGTRAEAEKENRNDLAKIASKMGCDAVIFITDNTTAENPDKLISNGIAVKYLSPEQVEKRNKKAEEPPVLKKENPLDPEPVLIKYKDVKFPYKVIGILEIHTSPTENNFSSQAMDFRLGEDAARNRADAVIFVTYSRGGSNVTQAVGIMVKSYPDWRTVEDIKAKEVEMTKARQEALKKQEEEKKQQEESGEIRITE